MSRARAERIARLLRRTARGEAGDRPRLRRVWARADALELERPLAGLRGRPPRAERDGEEEGG